MQKQKLKRMSGAVLAAVLAVCVLCSCSNTGQGSGSGSSSDTSSASSADNGDTYRDSLGREVQVPTKINRIAALDSFSGEVMVLVGAGDKMVACPNGTKSDTLLQKIDPKLKSTAVVQSGGDINAEQLLALKPDVILIKQEMYETSSVKNKLDKLGIPYLVVGSSDMDDQIAWIKAIGELAGGTSEKTASGVASYYQDVITRIKKDASKIPSGKKLSVYHCTNGVSVTDGTDSLGADWVSTVGCKDVSVGANLQNDGKNYYTTSEQLFVWNPDVIISQEAATAESLLTDASWKGLTAVKQKKVYNIPVSATRWGQDGDMETFFAMIWLGVTVYPDYYKDFDLKQEVTSFYQKYEGLTITDKLYKQILSGEGLRMVSTGNGSGSGTGTGAGTGAGSGTGTGSAK